MLILKTCSILVHWNYIWITVIDSTWSQALIVWKRLQVLIDWKYQQFQMCRLYHSNGRNQGRTKEILDDSESREWKSCLKTQYSKTEIMASGPIPSWQIEEKQWKQWHTLFSWAPKSLHTVTATMKWKDTCSLDRKKCKVLITQSCLTLYPMDCSLPGSSVHGILQARVLELVAFPFSRGSYPPRDWPQISSIAGTFFII